MLMTHVAAGPPDADHDTFCQPCPRATFQAIRDLADQSPALAVRHPFVAMARAAIMANGWTWGWLVESDLSAGGSLTGRRMLIVRPEQP